MVSNQRILTARRAHAHLYELDHILMGVGALLFLSGMTEGLWAILAGVALHMTGG